MNCEYCTKEFSTKSSLSYHQKTAKYCLEKQGKSNEEYKCSYCEKCFTTKQRLDEHKNQSCKLKGKVDYMQEIISLKNELEICKKQEKMKLKDKDSLYQQQLKEKDSIYQQNLKEKDIYLSNAENIINEKNEYISKLEAKLEKMEAKLDAKLEKLESTVTTIALESKTVSTKASQAITTTNNTTLNTNITVNNVLNLSEEHVKKVLSERLNYNVVYAGQAGLATFVVDNMLKDAAGKLIYRCVDASRQMFEFIDENGETVRDMKAEKLTQSLLKGDVIKLGLEAAAVGWNTENEKLNTERVGVFGPKVNEYADLNRNNTVFRSKVSSLTT
jgi:hypothetical protein